MCDQSAGKCCAIVYAHSVYDKLIIAASNIKMRTEEAQDWQKMSPLLYSYLSSISAPEFSSISNATFSRQSDKNYFKFDEYRSIIAGHSNALNGLLTVNTIMVPMAGGLDDERARTTLKRICELNFQSQVTHFDECVRREEQGPCSTFLAVVQRRNPHIYVYDSAMLEKCREKASINPRMVLRGHQSEVTVLKCRRDQVLSGSKNGEVRMHNLKYGEDSVVYKYHREQVHDCCWLTAQDDSPFLSSSSEGIIYMWDKRNSIPVSKIQPKQGEVTCLEYLRDNCFLSGGKDGTVKLHDVRSGINKFYTFKDHTASVTSIKKMQGKEGKEGDVPHQVLFASGALNGEVMLWGEELEFVHLGHRSEVKCIAYDRSTEMFCTVEKKCPVLCLWKPAIFNYQ